MNNELHFITSTIISSTLFFALNLSYIMYNKSITLIKKSFIPYSNDKLNDAIVFDCTHPTAQQLTHHLKTSKQKKLMNLKLRGDTSTDSVISAILENDKIYKQFKYVTTNHYDIDSFLSIWCAINPLKAVKYEKLIRECAIIGDFRELNLNYSYQYHALHIICLLNTIEKIYFYKPFESKITANQGELDYIQKFDYFLDNFHNIINPIYLHDNDDINIKANKEFFQIIKEYHQIHSYPKLTSMPTILDYNSIISLDSIGLVIIKTNEPLHYYSLFSCSRGYDIVLSIYDNNRYELELKYTTYVDINSRPTLPRVDLHYLTKYLNNLETNKQSINNVINEEYIWRCDAINDSGPILRLELNNNKSSSNLTKAERYADPYERTIYTSILDPTFITQLIISYFNYAYYSTNNNMMMMQAKKDWNWNEIHIFNKSIQWELWNPTPFVN